MWPAVISTGPDNYPLNASYKTADGYAFQVCLLSTYFSEYVILAFRIRLVIISYDLGCSWKIFRGNLQDCSRRMPCVLSKL